jgi:hypothetical protein
MFRLQWQGRFTHTNIRDEVVVGMLPHAGHTHNIRDTGRSHRPLAHRHNMRDNVVVVMPSHAGAPHGSRSGLGAQNSRGCEA